MVWWAGAPVSSWCAARQADSTGCPYRQRSAKRWSPTFGGRNPADAVHLFLTCGAPRGPIHADLVGELLRQGAGLVAISQVLHRRDLPTTALYVEVGLDTGRAPQYRALIPSERPSWLLSHNLLYYCY